MNVINISISGINLIEAGRGYFNNNNKKQNQGA